MQQIGFLTPRAKTAFLTVETHDREVQILGYIGTRDVWGGVGFLLRTFYRPTDTDYIRKQLSPICEIGLDELVKQVEQALDKIPADRCRCGDYDCTSIGCSHP